MKKLISLILLLTFGIAFAEKAPPLTAAYSADKVAENAWVIHGPLGMPNPENQGFMNNPGFIIADKGVVVVDPGASVQSGDMVLKHIRKLTDKPIVAVFNTHVHGDHWLGNQSIVEAFPQVKIYAHAKMIERVAGGAGETWVSRMLSLTKGATAGTKIVNANTSVKDAETIKAAGMDFQILHNEKAHTDTDIMIYVPALKMIFLGDNAGYGRILRITDGNFMGNIEALNNALATGATIFIPGHGKTAGTEAASEYRDYLSAVYAGVKPFYEEGLSDFEIKPKLVAKLARWKDWQGFDELLGNHISLAYLEIEAAEF